MWSTAERLHTYTHTHKSLLSLSLEARNSTITLWLCLYDLYFFGNSFIKIRPSLITSCHLHDHSLSPLPMALHCSQAWKSHVQCWCSEFSTLQQLTFVRCPLSVTVHSIPYAHYLIWISWQHHNLSLIIILHMRKLRQVDQAVRSSDQTQVVWFQNIYSLLISPKFPLSSHRIPGVGVFDGAKLLLFNFLGWLICLSKCVTTRKYKVLDHKNTSFIPALFQEMAVLFALHITWCQGLPSTKPVAWK